MRNDLRELEMKSAMTYWQLKEMSSARKRSGISHFFIFISHFSFFISLLLLLSCSTIDDDLSDGITWPSKYALPPYDDNGNSIHQRRVFIQHYMTTATFVIGQYSLQHALVSVPDLRSSQLSLGLSVDLKWQTGLNFDNIVLGE